MTQPTHPVVQSRSDAADTPTWYPACRIAYTRDTWVKLLAELGPYAADEGKLLCQAADDEWAVWVPNHGEVVLAKSLFYC